MVKDVWAIYFHKASTDEKPNHMQCDKSWYKYLQAKEENKPYTHKNSLDPDVIKAIKPTFTHLAQRELLKNCLHGRTQNVNESLNSVLWSRVPKNNFVGLKTLQFGALDAVITYNEGNKGRIKVLRNLGVRIGNNCLKTLYCIDRERVVKADKAAQIGTKEARKRSRMIKKKLIEDEKKGDQDYEAGMF